MRVVYVSSTDDGGPVSHLLGLAPAMARLGVDVRVVCASPHLARSLEAAGVPTTILRLRHKLDLRAAAALPSLLRHADVVHTHDRRTGLFARVLGRATGARVVHTVHGIPEEIAGQVGRDGAGRPPAVSRMRAAWLMHGYLRIEAALARLGSVVTPSHAMARFLRAHHLRGRAVHVIPNAIDVRRTAPRPGSDVVAVGAVARLEYWKGLDVLIAAAARVSRPLHLEIFGDGSLRDRLEAQAAALGVSARFHGHVDDVRSRLDALDLVVMPSRAENLPMAILEAMAAALPVVATRVGGVPELVDHGRTGLLVDVDDVDGLAAAIESLAADRDHRVALGRQAAQRARQHFDARTLARRMADLYAGVAAAAGR